MDTNEDNGLEPNNNYDNIPQYSQSLPRVNNSTGSTDNSSKKRFFIIFILIFSLLAVVIFSFWLSQSGDSPSSSNQVSIVDITPEIPDDWSQHELRFDSQTFSFYIPSDWEVDSGNYIEPSGLYADIVYRSPDYGSLFMDGYENTNEGARVIVRVSETGGEDYNRILKNAKDREDARENLLRLRDVEETMINDVSAITYVQNADLSRVVYLHGSDYSVEFKFFSSFEYDETQDTIDYDDTHLDDLYKIIMSFHTA